MVRRRSRLPGLTARGVSYHRMGGAPFGPFKHQVLAIASATPGHFRRASLLLGIAARPPSRRAANDMQGLHAVADSRPSNSAPLTTVRSPLPRTAGNIGRLTHLLRSRCPSPPIPEFRSWGDRTPIGWLAAAPRGYPLHANRVRAFWESLAWKIHPAPDPAVSASA